MQAYVAIQRKLLILIWALWRKYQVYDPDFCLKHFSKDLEEVSLPGQVVVA